MRLNRYWRFLLVALAVSAAVQIAYLRTHQFPALLGGLFLEMAQTIGSSGELVPATIDGFTTDGVPFAYPPLGFYVISVFLELGVDGPQFLRFGAPLVLLCNVALLYHVTVVLTDSLETGLFAGIITGTHLSLNVFLVGAGGFVRGLGFLWMLVALLGAYQYFANDGGRRALAVTVVGWGLVVLTHPVHAAATGIGVAAAWLVWDRSPVGLATGAGVAVAGLAIASPWWLTVVSDHGPGIFLAGAGSHSSLNHSPSDIAALGRWFYDGGYVMNWPAVFTVLGATVMVARGNWHQPAWLAVPVVALVPPHGRLAILVVAPLGATGLVYTLSVLREAEIDLPERFRNRIAAWDVSTQQVVTVAFVLLLLGPFVAQNMATAEDTGAYSALPVYVDEDDRTAMEWIEDETPADAQVAVVGSASEWFPYLANRTSVIVPYGTEWQGQAAWKRHSSAQGALRNCWNASCMDTVLLEYEFAAAVDYVYVPYGSFVDGRSGANISPSLHQSLRASDQFTPVYRNEGVGVYDYNVTAAGSSEGPDHSGG